MRRLSAIFLTLLVAVALSGLLYAQSAGHSVFQVSTYHALKQGILEGETSFRELRKHGDFGIGTLNGLDGEMAALNGEFFQIKADGRVHSIADDERTPFAVVTFFRSDKKVSLPRINNMKELQSALERIQANGDGVFAIKVSANFQYVKARSVPRQEKPYPALEEALKHQTEFELKDVQGTLVGFRFPKFMDGVNVPGDHFHFITDDKRAGGHVLDCRVDNANLEVAVISNLSLRLPRQEKVSK
ncbi:MAG TPA: acetolactate decarboxylase [Desulfomonilaceae bacterium]|nr:acetolactate decarboxylase [Desulfomonilaceae bacterium]